MGRGSLDADADNSELTEQPGIHATATVGITQQSMGAANTAFDALRERAANRAAATNNSAGFGDLTSQLGASRHKRTRRKGSRTRSHLQIRN